MVSIVYSPASSTHQQLFDNIVSRLERKWNIIIETHYWYLSDIETNIKEDSYLDFIIIHLGDSIYRCCETANYIKRITQKPHLIAETDSCIPDQWRKVITDFDSVIRPIYMNPHSLEGLLINHNFIKDENKSIIDCSSHIIIPNEYILKKERDSD